MPGWRRKEIPNCGGKTPTLAATPGPWPYEKGTMSNARDVKKAGRPWAARHLPAFGGQAVWRRLTSTAVSW